MAKKQEKQVPTGEIISAAEVDILRVNKGRMTCYVRGVTPLIYNAMSEKARHELLYPSPKKTRSQKESTAKHNPPEEFRGSVYTSPTGPTRLAFPAVCFKRALASAALDLGSAKKAQIERLVWAVGEKIPIWGIPRLRMDVVRMADIKRTPDIRTRACLEEWACKIELAFVKPAINETVVANLLASAGLIRGVGDFRQEKGAGNYGQFELVNPDDPDWNRIVETCGRAEQEEALANPVCYDEESEKFYAWWHEEARRRGHAKTRGKHRGNGASKGKGNGSAEAHQQ
jgi:hypothetical protein